MKFNSRGFTSLLLALATFAMSFSGVMLYFTPRGRVANWTGWTLLGLSKETWVAVHMNIAVLFVLVALLHLILNWTMFWGYIKKRASVGLNMKGEMLAAAVVAGGIVTGAIYDVRPFNMLMTLNRQIKDSWEMQASDAPAPHAEEFGLNRFAAGMGLSTSDITAALHEDGFAIPSENATVGQIAEANGVTPQDIHAAITKRFPQASQGGQGPDAREHKPGEGAGRGMGRGMGKGMGGGGKRWQNEE